MPFVDRNFNVKRIDYTTWELQDELVYKGKYQDFTVPRRFLTDFASVPQFMLWLIPSTGKYTLAAVLHDYFCDVGIQIGEISPRDADGVFRRVLRELKVSWLQRWTLWTGVRWGALFNPVRRPGIAADIPLMLLLSLLLLPVVLPASLGIGIGYAIYWILNLLTGGKKK